MIINDYINVSDERLLNGLSLVVRIMVKLEGLLDAVSRTQVRANVIPLQTQEISFKSVDEMLNYCSKAIL